MFWKSVGLMGQILHVQLRVHQMVSVVSQWCVPGCMCTRVIISRGNSSTQYVLPCLEQTNNYIIFRNNFFFVSLSCYIMIVHSKIKFFL